MGILLRVVWHLFKGVVAAVAGAAGVEICHQFKWFPDKDLADLIMATPSHFSLTAAYWSLVAVAAILLLFAEHWFAPYIKRFFERRRHRATEQPHRSSTARPIAHVVFGTGQPFESIDPAGVNRRQTVRVKIQNESGAHISNGTVRINDLDPADKDHKIFFLKGDISLPPHESTFIDVAYRDIGSSEAKPGRSMRLCVPIGPAYFGRLPGTLPLEPHTFYLEFSTPQVPVLDRAFCRLFVDNEILRLVDGVAGSAISAPQEISLHDAAVRLYEAAEEHGFLDFLVNFQDSSDKRFETVKHQLIVDKRINLSGIRSPSTKPRAIPRDELTYEMFPGAGNTVIDTHSKETVWHDVSMPTRDLGVVIADFIEHTKKVGGR
jgi:hypothetical protein